MRLPTDARFAAQLAEACRLRDALPAADARADALRASGLAGITIVEGLAAPQRRLRQELAVALGLSCELERLHGAIPSFSHAPAAHADVMRHKRALLAPLASPACAARFEAEYRRLVLEHVAPLVAAALPGTDELHFAAVPTLRVQTPSSTVATIRPHCDGQYGLQPGSLNFWVPLTRVDEVSALWAESSPGRGDYRPMLEPSRFDGRACVHFSLPNRSGRTRASIDFRVVPGALFDASSRLARCGYFSTAVCPAAGRPWELASAGRVSELHGLPHEGPAAPAARGAARGARASGERRAPAGPRSKRS